MNDARQFAPATQRNREPILVVLQKELPASGLVLEIASGTGEHAMHFSQGLPGLSWQPSDPSAGARASIAAWREAEGSTNLLAPIALDAAAQWPVEAADAIVCINMTHISPWEATEGLMRGAGRILPPGGPLYLYGPYLRSGYRLEPSNAAFDESLKSRDPCWGLRELDAVTELAAAHDLDLARVLDMPANNLSVIFRKR